VRLKGRHMSLHWITSFEAAEQLDELPESRYCETGAVLSVGSGYFNDPQPPLNPEYRCG